MLWEPGSSLTVAGPYAKRSSWSPVRVGITEEERGRSTREEEEMERVVWSRTSRRIKGRVRYRKRIGWGRQEEELEEKLDGGAQEEEVVGDNRMDEERRKAKQEEDMKKVVGNMRTVEEKQVGIRVRGSIRNQAEETKEDLDVEKK